MSYIGQFTLHKGVRVPARHPCVRGLFKARYSDLSVVFSWFCWSLDWLTVEYQLRPMHDPRIKRSRRSSLRYIYLHFTYLLTYLLAYVRCACMLSERVPWSGGAVYELRLWADGPVSRHSGGGGRTEWGLWEERVTWSTRQAQDGHRVWRKEGCCLNPLTPTFAIWIIQLYKTSCVRPG